MNDHLDPVAVLRRYIEAANRHDMIALRALLAEEGTWQLGPDTLRGVAEMLRPHAFDQGANTRLAAGNVAVSGDVVDFDLREENDVLGALGIPAPHHFVRIEIREGQIWRIAARKPAVEQAAFVERVVAFAGWLKETQPGAYERLWPEGRFNYSRDVGEEMPGLVAEWQRVTGAADGGWKGAG